MGRDERRGVDDLEPLHFLWRTAFLDDLDVDHVEMKSLKSFPENRANMSQATKIVLGTIGAAVVVGLLLLVVTAGV